MNRIQLSGLMAGVVAMTALLGCDEPRPAHTPEGTPATVVPSAMPNEPMMPMTPPATRPTTVPGPMGGEQMQPPTEGMATPPTTP